jgi:hypothetical protein
VPSGESATTTGHGFEGLRQTEVQHLHHAIGPHFHVGGLEIAMHNPQLVRRFDRLGDLRRDRQRVVDRNRSLRDAIRQRRPLNQLHDEGRGAVALLQTVNGRDVRMIEPGEHFGFALETCQPLAIGRHGLGQHLDGDGALQVGIGRAVDLAHAAGAEFAGDFIWAESSARSERHRNPLELYGDAAPDEPARVHRKI